MSISEIISNFSRLPEYFKYSFVRNALYASVLIAICAAMLGVFLVLKRYSTLSDGLSHVAFGAAAIAASFGIMDTRLALPITVAAAIFILKTRPERRIMGDAVIAAVSVGAVAVGYILLSRGEGEANLGGDVCTALFGSSAILSVGYGQLFGTLIMTAVLIILVVIYRYKLLTVTLDESFARSTGTRTGAYETAIAVVCAVCIVVGMKLAGALLISALALFPALCALRLVKGFSRVIAVSAVIGALGAVVGVVLSVALGTPVGATVAGVDIAVYGVVCLIRLKK